MECLAVSRRCEQSQKGKRSRQCDTEDAVEQEADMAGYPLSEAAAPDSAGADVTTITINRGPVLVLWVAVVSMHLGYSWESAITFGRCIANRFSAAKGMPLLSPCCEIAVLARSPICPFLSGWSCTLCQGGGLA